MSSFELARLLPTGVVVAEVTCQKNAADELLPLLDGEADERLLRSAEKRQREFRAGRHAARTAIEKLGVRMAKIPRSPDGPPLFPAGISGSISHTGRESTYAIAVATREPLLVGVDAEEVRPLEEGVEERVLLPGERASLEAGCPSMDVCLLAFSAKEAVYKALYPRHETFFDFHAVRLTLGAEGSFRAEVPFLGVARVEVRWVRFEGLLVTLASCPRSPAVTG